MQMVTLNIIVETLADSTYLSDRYKYKFHIWWPPFRRKGPHLVCVWFWRGLTNDVCMWFWRGLTNDDQQPRTARYYWNRSSGSLRCRAAPGGSGTVSQTARGSNQTISHSHNYLERAQRTERYFSDQMWLIPGPWQYDGNTVILRCNVLIQQDWHGNVWPKIYGLRCPSYCYTTPATPGTPKLRRPMCVGRI